jgi:hypothetical protein
MSTRDPLSFVVIPDALASIRLYRAIERVPSKEFPSGHFTVIPDALA